MSKTTNKFSPEVRECTMRILSSARKVPLGLPPPDVLQDLLRKAFASD
jgi:hypothetical protein